jgi:hypothetical protein
MPENFALYTRSCDALPAAQMLALADGIVPTKRCQEPIRRNRGFPIDRVLVFSAFGRARVSGTRRVAAPVSPFAPRKYVLVGARVSGTRTVAALRPTAGLHVGRA